MILVTTAFSLQLVCNAIHRTHTLHSDKMFVCGCLGKVFGVWTSWWEVLVKNHPTMMKTRSTDPLGLTIDLYERLSVFSFYRLPTCIDLNNPKGLIVMIPGFINVYLFCQVLNYISVRVVMENYSVKLDNFHKNMHLYLKHQKDFFDVTLACDDNQQIEAYKISLSSESLFFISTSTVCISKWDKKKWTSKYCWFSL